MDDSNVVRGSDESARFHRRALLLQTLNQLCERELARHAKRYVKAAGESIAPSCPVTVVQFAALVINAVSEQNIAGHRKAEPFNVEFSWRDTAELKTLRRIE